MTSVFDGSTRQHDNAEPHGGYHTEAIPEPVQAGPLDTLTLLREAVAEQQEEASHLKTVVIDVPGGRFRLHCSPVISSRDLRRWQAKSLPGKARTSGRINPLMMEQEILSSAVLGNTTRYMEVWHEPTEQWVVIEDSKTGEPLTFHDGLPKVLGALDMTSAVRKLFLREADLLRAAEKVMVAAGYSDGDGEGDEEDPTV